jgi:hypothetical protein
LVHGRQNIVLLATDADDFFDLVGQIVGQAKALEFPGLVLGVDSSQ